MLLMKTVGFYPNHGEPDTAKVVRPVRREGGRNLPLKSGKALPPYSTRPRVIEIAELWGYDATAAWVRVNRDLYAQGIFEGFQVVGEGETPCAD